MSDDEGTIDAETTALAEVIAAMDEHDREIALALLSRNDRRAVERAMRALEDAA